jgi:hypothetical protein
MARIKGSRGGDGLRPGEPQKPAKVKLKLSLDRETVRLLKLEAFGRDCPIGQVLDDLVRATPRRFVLTDRGPRSSAAPESPGQAPAEGPSRARGDFPALGVVSEAV